MKSSLGWREIAGRIDAALLKATSSRSDLLILSQEAAQLGYRSLCVAPYLVESASRLLEKTNVKVGTVVGFTLGFNTLSSKLQEVRTAAQMGAREVDYVVGLGGYFSDGVEFVEIEASNLIGEARDLGIDVVKAIVEVGYLTKEQTREICMACSSAGVDFLKTSTGYGPRPTTPEDVRLMVEAVSGRTPVKAAGGIKNLEDAMSMFGAGARLIGTSSGKKIIDEAREREGQA
jgi:deoxyribose-phosphate aldolase